MADVVPSHGHSLVFWVDGSVTPGIGLGGAACVAEEHGIYVMHDNRKVFARGIDLGSGEVELAAIVLAQVLISTLDDEARARACVVTDSLQALAEWWSHTRYRGGAPVFHSDRDHRPVAYQYAHYLANTARRGAGSMQPCDFWKSCGASFPVDLVEPEAGELRQTSKERRLERDDESASLPAFCRRI